jgi:phosphoribosylaminoimidazole-succinocarboxamide synthase
MLPPGLRNGSVIPGGPIWTPTTKAKKGHDLPLNYLEVDREYPGVQQASLEIFQAIGEIADRAGYIQGDGKFEGSFYRGSWRWCDERGTTDSSRYVSKKEYEEQFVGKGGSLPASKDKEILRKAGQKLGIDLLDPTSEEDRERVKQIRFPLDVIEEMQAASQEIFGALTGHSLKQFQREVMGIRS